MYEYFHSAEMTQKCRKTPRLITLHWLTQHWFKKNFYSLPRETGIHVLLLLRLSRHTRQARLVRVHLLQMKSGGLELLASAAQLTGPVEVGGVSVPTADGWSVYQGQRPTQHVRHNILWPHATATITVFLSQCTIRNGMSDTVSHRENATRGWLIKERKNNNSF